jgi:crooked neck
VDQNFYVSYAKFEIREKEIEKARSIFKSALEKLPKSQSSNLYNEYVLFEKQHGVSDRIEVVVLSKRRKKYEADLEVNAHNYDTWFAYIKLEEEIGDYARIRDLYERAISKVPPVSEKRFWRRYVYLWLFYAVWEESVAQDVDRAREVYVQSLKVIPHKTFTFAKLWIQYARFLIRQKDLVAARKTLGMSVGICPKARLFKGYIELELSLREFDRIRTLYEKFLEWNPTNCTAWMKYAEFERMIDDIDRARGIYEIAVQQNMLDMPEVLWKAYIDFESDNSEYSKARALYERLLDKTQHVKVT